MLDRLKQERVKWRQSHPHGFVARPKAKEDGTMDLTEWDAGIPGPRNTPFENGLFPLRIMFPSTYPKDAPRVFFTPPVFHPNVYPSGEVCSSILSTGWSSCFSVSDLLLAMQTLLAEPNPASPANTEAFKLFTMDQEGYESRVRLLASKLSMGGKETIEACIDRFMATEHAEVKENQPNKLLVLDE